HVDRIGRPSRTGDDAALNTDSRGDLTAGQATVARGAGDRRLIAQIATNGLLALHADRVGGGTRPNGDGGAGHLVLLRRRGRLADRLRFGAEKLAEPVGDRWARVRRARAEQ